MNRRQFLVGSIGTALTSAVSLSSYALWIEPEWAEVVRRPLHVHNLPGSAIGQSIVQLSDLHIGPSVDDEYLLSVFTRVQAMSPDYVALTGDFVTYRDASELRRLGALSRSFPRGRSGTLAVLGNHDYGQGWSESRVAKEVTEILQEAGIMVLRNESASIRGLTILGADDLWAREFNPVRMFADWKPTTPSIVLCHNPDAVDYSGWAQYKGWVLSGHTHGGQCRLPFMDPPRLPVANVRYTSGEFDLGDGRMLYINRGVGTLWKVRFNVRPEITVFQLQTA